MAAILGKSSVRSTCCGRPGFVNPADWLKIELFVSVFGTRWLVVVVVVSHADAKAVQVDTTHMIYNYLYGETIHVNYIRIP